MSQEDKEKFQEYVKSFGIEDSIDAIAELVEKDLNAYKIQHLTPTGSEKAVIGLLESAFDSLKAASFDYYASLK